MKELPVLHELRAYDLTPGKGPEYLELFRTNGVQFVTRHLPMAGYWLTDTGALNRIYHLWIYENLAERADCRAGLIADPEWNNGFVPKGFPLIVSQQNYLMKCTASSTLLDQVIENRKMPHRGQDHITPMFGDNLLSLSFGNPTMDRDCLAQWTVLSGTAPGEKISLFQHTTADDALGSAIGTTRHEILRPLSCSPLR